MLVFLIHLIWAQQSADLALLRADIEELTKGQVAQYGVAFHEPGSGDSLYLDAERNMHAASTMKVPVMMRLFDKIAAGQLRLDQPIRVVNQFASIIDGSPYVLDVSEDDEALLYRKLGEEVPLKSLMEAMIIHSSNLATNLLIALADAPSTTALMRQLGAPKIEVLRGVQDIKAYEAGQSNRCNAKDMMTIMLAAANDGHFKPTHREQMLGIMRRVVHRDIIAAGIPKNSGATVANKVGRISSVEHDAAIVDLGDGRRYALVIFADHIDNEATRAQVIKTGQRISKRIYEHVVGRNK